MEDRTKSKLLVALELASGVLERLGGFEDAGATEKWEQMRRDLEAELWEKHFSVADNGELAALDAEANVLLIFSGIFEESAELVSALMKLNGYGVAQTKLWDKVRDALSLADDVSQRLGGFIGLDAERWEQLHRDVEAERWARHFRISATAKGYRLEPLTNEARTLALFMEILEDIDNHKATSK